MWLTLKGWYVPSRNGAAVISFPGRKGPQKPARMLARHGYGVLVFDRRGEGESDGEPNIFGWGGDSDIKAAIRFLQQRPDVDPGRIAPRPILLIAAPNSKNGEKLNREYYAAAQEPKALWEIPESNHTGGIDARPRQYERRVVGFFDDALL